VVLLATLGAAVAVGPASVGIADVWSSAWSHLTGGGPTLSRVQEAIVWQGRAPRALTAVGVGAGLAMAGVVMQALTHNPLADPYLLGVSSGASVGAVAALLAGVTAVWALPLAAFAGALAALATTLLLAGRGASPVRMILAGVAVGYLASALVSLLVFRSSRGDAYREILSWLLGSLASSRWWEAGLALTVSAVVGAVVLARSRTFDALLLGDDAAVSLGVPVRRERPWLMGLVAVLTGALVAVSGAIGFIGLVVPHAARILVGQRHRALLPVAALAGGLFLLLADTAARTLLDPVEVPVGIITALVGGPAFALLLRRVP
jgi:iron complex transport system permease protein